METIRVNMTPCEDIKTIHASQNDNEAREWGFELHNNGELIDTSEITEQMFFKAYKGGTEQLLPENTSTPTTSPFKGDIKYPQGLLTDQEFTYRESPTESDGLAFIKSIKGNTLVWNQLQIIPTQVTITTNGVTFTNNNDGTITANGTATAQARYACNGASVPTGHKVLIKGCPSGGSIASYCLLDNFQSANKYDVGNGIIYETTTASVGLKINIASGTTVNNLVFRPQVFDLTQMFGSGNEPTSVSEFTSLFSLPYYAYNQGSLLSFNGEQIKTVGFNQWDEEWESGTIGNDGSKVASVSRIRSKNFVHVLPNTTYYTQINNYSIPSYACLRYAYDADKNPIGVIGSNYSVSFTTPSNCHYILFSPNAQYGTTYKNDICINISDTSKNGTYEPYTSSTLSLPISTYFPNGMKSAGSVYDELTETKAITRIGSITLNGSEAWVKSASYTGNYYVLGILPDAKYPVPNAISNRLILVYNTTQLSENDLCFMFDGTPGSLNINIKNTSMATVDQFKAWLQANPVAIYYELATSTETSFTTASLVTEKGETPLSNEDGVLIGKCTEQLSSESGFFDAKIKLADEDGECYSNKIQLHVERKPS